MYRINILINSAVAKSARLKTLFTIICVTFGKSKEHGLMFANRLNLIHHQIADPQLHNNLVKIVYCVLLR